MSSDDVTPIESAKKTKPMSPLDAMSPEAKKAFWDSVFFKLTDSDRFLKFVDANYDIGFLKDDDAKTFEITVIEKPVSVGPPLSAEQRFKLHVACMRAGAKEPLVLMGHIFKLLGQEPPSSIITSADDAELKRAVAEAESQDSLKKGLDD